MVDSGSATIYDFLLGLVVDGDSGTVRAEVERHRERTMTVVFRDRTETITRCATCREEAHPCTALRVLALRFAEHPAYRPEWRPAPADAAEDAETAGIGLVPRQRGAEVPPPGIARRRVLRQYGISFRESDFTEGELAQRRIAIGTRAREGHD